MIFEIRPGGHLEPYASSPIEITRRSWTVVANPVFEEIYLSDSLDSSVTAMIGPIFADGFESGDISAWSDSAP